MDVNFFYSKRKVFVPARSIPNPEVSEESDLSSDSDEFDIVLESDLVSETEEELDVLESDSEAEQPDTLPPTASKPAKKPKIDHFRWRTVPIENTDLQEFPFTGNPPLGQLPIQEPIDYFRDIIGDELIAHIVSESNIYASQIDINKPLNLTVEELEQFIGILFVMSIVKMPSTRDYWEQNMGYDKIADVMPTKRFEQIKRFLHLNNNMQMPKDCPDKLFKVWPLINAIKERFQMIAPTEILRIDEQMVPFKGRSKLKQYNQQKPKKWGYKLYVLTSPEGSIFNFEVHTGTIDICPGQPDLQASGNIVTQFLQYIPRHQWFKLFIDNWCTGVPLATTLMKQGIGMVGTVRANRLRDCQLSSYKSLHRKGRGSAEIKICVCNNVELRAIKWFHNSGVTILTTFEAVVP